MPLSDDLLAPIPGEHPGGARLAYSPLFDQIKQARRQDDWKSMVTDDSVDVKKVDSERVIDLAEGGLATQSKDLWLAVWLTEALIGRDQFEGLREGIDLIRGLIENFWDSLYPEIEDGDAEMRATPLEWLGNYQEPDKGSSPALAVRYIALTKRGHTFFQYKEAQSMGREEEVRDSDSRRKVRELAIQEKKTPPEAIDTALIETPKTYLRALEAGLKGSLASLQTLGQLCDEKFGNAAPSFRKLRMSLEEVGAVLRVLLVEKLKQDPDPVGASGDASAAEGWADGTGAAGPAPISLRFNDLKIDPARLDELIAAELKSGEDVVLRVAAVARYLRQREPGSPVSYLLLRALRWGELRDSDSPTQVLEAPPAAIRAALRQQAQASNWRQVLEIAETAMSQPFGRGWLDIQRYAIRACEKMGYKNAAKALRAELKTLLGDIPELPRLIMHDDTGTANPDTLAWLQQEGFIGQAGPG
jgi:type VI secretion system protein ImpA